MTVLEQLQKLQQAIAQRNDSDWSVEGCEKLLFCDVADLWHIEFYGDPSGESFEDFLHLLCKTDVANQVKSLVFRGPDEGANGTRTWQFTELINRNVEFPHLTSLFIEPTAPEHHNGSIIGSEENDYEEKGDIGRLLAKAPRLESLTIPSAPDASFFQVGQGPLKYLRVDTGFFTQNFILNLSHSSCFPNLYVLDFGDYNERDMKDYPEACTPFEHYMVLFQSQAFSTVRRFVLRNTICSKEQLYQLQNLRKQCQFFLLQAPHGEYVSNMENSNNSKP